MMRSVLAGLAAIFILGATARAQVITAGSTAEGDYLRGVGIAAAGYSQLAAGIGQMNRNNAIAGNIQAQTAIMVTDYIRATRLADAQARARERIARHVNQVKMLAAIHDRILNNPNLSDFRKGDTHNALLVKLRTFTPSEIGPNGVVLSANLVRQIPFKLNEKALVISIPRMMHRNNSWPPEFQDVRFATWKTAYDRAMNAALDEFVEINIQQRSVAKLRDAIDDLKRELEKSQDKGKGYFEALNHLDDLKKYSMMLEYKKAQDVLVDLDSYSGTTVAELLKFMDDHNVQFDVAERPQEMRAYREIYDALDKQRSLLDGGAPRANK